MALGNARPYFYIYYNKLDGYDIISVNGDDRAPRLIVIIYGTIPVNLERFQVAMQGAAGAMIAPISSFLLAYYRFGGHNDDHSAPGAGTPPASIARFSGGAASVGHHRKTGPLFDRRTERRKHRKGWRRRRLHRGFGRRGRSGSIVRFGTGRPVETISCG